MGNIKFLCTYCNTPFASRGSINRHLRCQHKVDPHPYRNLPFECNVCRKKFSCKNSLRRHLNTLHKPYEREEIFISVIPRSDFVLSSSFEDLVDSISDESDVIPKPDCGRQPKYHIAVSSESYPVLHDHSYDQQLDIHLQIIQDEKPINTENKETGRI